MKKVFVALLLCSAVFMLNSSANAVSLTGIYDFRDQFNATTTSFEGLDFTDDGTLWITSAPNYKTPHLIGVNLETTTVLSKEDYTNYVTKDVFGGWLSSPFNPVALASDGINLFVGSNGKSSVFYNYLYTTDQTARLEDGSIKFSGGACNDPEGAAYLGGAIYITCQESQKIIKLNTDGTVEDVMTGVTALGLGATDNGSLIIGDYVNHDLLLYDVQSDTIANRIDLNALFTGYEVVDPDGIIRYVPDPDGIAYRNGKIYMTFEHDLRVFEISLKEPPVATPEPGTVLLLGLGLLGLTAGLRKKRA